MSSQLKQIWIDRAHVICRPAQVYAAITAIFNVTGAVLVSMCGLRATAAAGGATTLFTAWNGVLGEVAAVDIGTGTLVGEVVSLPLNVLGVIGGSFGAIPQTNALLYGKGMYVGSAPAAVGVVNFTFAVSTWTGTIFAVFRKLTPESNMVLA